MDLIRINREFTEARLQFPNIELYKNVYGTPFVNTVLQITSGQIYVAAIHFPSSYPNQMPEVYIESPKINSLKHMYNKGNICYLLPSMWNPGKHDLLFVLAHTTIWLHKYLVYRSTGTWPGASVPH